ncbi:MAG: hypothetical protein RLZZ582_190, partial [Verrucomicrobiota bacterium]
PHVRRNGHRAQIAIRVGVGRVLNRTGATIDLGRSKALDGVGSAVYLVTTVKDSQISSTSGLAGQNP